MDVTEQQINEAWTRIIEGRPDVVPFNEEELRKHLFFTEIFLKKKVQDLPKKYLYISGKAFSKLIAGIIVSFLIAGSITAYAVFRALQTHINEKNTDISMNTETQEKANITERVFPKYVPNNFKETERSLLQDSTVIRYSDGNSDVTFRQELATSEGQIDNEDTVESVEVINGIEAIFFEKHGEKTIIFTKYGYLFYIDSNSSFITKEELVKMAKSVKQEEKGNEDNEKSNK